MNALDRLIAYISPHAGMRRQAAREALAYYEAGEPSRLRKFRRNRGSQNELVQRGAIAVREQARYLCRNHDLTRGALRTMVNNVVGANGIGIEPQPLRADGKVHTEYAEALLKAYENWCRFPEVTHKLPYPRLQRALARAWIRDGEVFGQMITGTRSDLDHGTDVPFSLEAFEADLVPFELSDPAKNIVQGIERNAWGKPIAVHFLKQNPGSLSLPTLADTKRIPWDRVLHLASFDHIGQVRGMSEFASVITRAEDIKDYEESERVAAKIAARLTGYVKRGNPDTYEAPEGGHKPRTIEWAPGTIIDDLAAGEEIGLINSNRPNPNLVTFRQGQLQAFAAGFGASYSSISRDYSGTYSSQRQELVEQWVNYAVLCDEFTGEVVKPTWEQFVIAAHLSRVVPIPKDVVRGTEANALYVAQSMPWINPLHEAQAWKELVESNQASEIEAIRRRGRNPREVVRQMADFADMLADAEVKRKGAASTKPATSKDNEEDDDTDPPVPGEQRQRQ